MNMKVCAISYKNRPHKEPIRVNTKDKYLNGVKTLSEPMNALVLSHQQARLIFMF